MQAEKLHGFLTVSAGGKQAPVATSLRYHKSRSWITRNKKKIMVSNAFSSLQKNNSFWWLRAHPHFRHPRLFKPLLSGRYDCALASLSRKHAHNTQFAFDPRRSSCFITVALLLLPIWEKQSPRAPSFGAQNFIFSGRLFISMNSCIIRLILIKFSAKKK